MSSSEGIPILVVLFLALIACGWHLHLAWCRPAAFQTYLDFWGSFFDGWLPSAQQFWISPLSAWLLRLSFALGFLVILGGIILILLRML
jgi:hypothetical protein